MKRTARVLNVARGGIIDEQALADALTAGTIAGAAVDVFAAEPTPADQPLRTAPNCVLTPHLGASTAEAQENVALEAAQLVSDYLLRGQVANAVNMTAVDPAELDGPAAVFGPGPPARGVPRPAGGRRRSSGPPSPTRATWPARRPTC